MKRALLKILPLLMLLSVILPASGASVHLSVSMPRGQRSIGVGERFYITYEISNSDAAPSRPASIPGAKMLYFERTGQSSSYSNVNGQVSQSRSTTWTLTAKATKEGTYTFGPVTVGGMKSNTVKYTVGKAASEPRHYPSASASQSGAQDADSSKPKFIGKGDGNLFLRASVSKTAAYEQEALVYTVKLYTSYDGIKFIGATASPKFEGFVVEESKAISNSLSFETYQGKTYATAIIARYIIFPQMQGKLKVIGNTYTVSVDQREYYHDPFWGSMSMSSPLQLNVTPNDLVIDVKPLPQPQPADFSGGVGNFTITSSLPSSSMLTNQGSSIVYTVKGTGNIKYLKLPELNALFPSEIEVYSPETDVKANVGATNVEGTATFDYTLIPLEEGTFKLPAVNLCFFNPATGKYQHVSAKGYTVNVGKGKASAKSQTRDRLRFLPDLMPVGDSLSSDHTPWIYTWTYWVIYALLFAALVASALIYRKRLKDMANIDAIKSRRAGKIAKKRLKKAELCMKKGDASRFYDEMLRAQWGYIAHKLKMPTSELTRDNVRQRLEESRIPDGVIGKVLGLLDDCEYAKYTPLANGMNMDNLYKQATEVISELEEAFRKASPADGKEEKLTSTLTEKLDRELNSSTQLRKDVEAARKATQPTPSQKEETPDKIEETLDEKE